MITAKRKPISEILSMVEGHKNVLLLACDGCVGIYDVGGLKQAEALKLELELAFRSKGKEPPNFTTATVLRQCDTEILKDSISEHVAKIDAVLSLACGVGVQTVAHVFSEAHVYPANNTAFLAMEDKKEGMLREWCMACGNCVLHLTGGICPIARCAKSLLNGPCGGFYQGKCEVDGRTRDCAWVLIFNKLKERGKLDLFTAIRLPKDYRDVKNPRELKREELVLPEAKEAIKILEEVEVKRRPAYSQLMKELSEGRFVVTGELEPVKTTDLTEVIEGAKLLRDYVVAINITDNPTAFAYLNALVPSYIIQEKAGVEAVYQMVTRDRNRLALTADLLAAGALGIKNILALAGDFTTVGDNPQAKKVWDIDSTLLIYLISKMVDEGVDLAGNPIHNPPKFNIGAAANPNADPLEPELYKLLRKQKAGVDFLQTQSMYDIEKIKHFLDECKSIGIRVPILIGITPFKSIKMMEWFVKNVPGVYVPEEMQERLRKARDRGKEAFIEENIVVFGELCREIRKTTSAAGIHMMAVGMESLVPRILEIAGIGKYRSS